MSGEYTSVNMQFSGILYWSQMTVFFLPRIQQEEQRPGSGIELHLLNLSDTVND